MLLKLVFLMCLMLLLLPVPVLLLVFLFSLLWDHVFSNHAFLRFVLWFGLFSSCSGLTLDFGFVSSFNKAHI